MILVDTTPLVALCDPRDRKHRPASAHLESLAAEEFAVCDAVLTEAWFHLPHAHQRLRLRAVLRRLQFQALPLTSDVTFWRDVFEWLAKYQGHDPDWADGCLAVLSARDKSLRVWTYDSEFRTTWRRADGTAIPLAVK